MTKFIHTIKDSEPVKTDNTVAIEWSYRVNSDGELEISGNDRVVQYIKQDGRSFSINGNARILGLDCKSDGSLLVR